LKIHVHDFSGHPFQFELSETLAALGNEVLHSYCQDFETGKFAQSRALSSLNLKISPIAIKSSFPKYSYLQRLIYEVKFACELKKVHKTSNADLIVVSNLPLFSAFIFYLLSKNEKKILWHQDIYSVAISKLLFQNRVIIKKMASALLQYLEKSVVLKSDFVVSITENFLKQYQNWRIPKRKLVVIENWASTRDFYPIEHSDQILDQDDNLARPERLIYAGSLGLKHNIDLLLNLERELNKESIRFEVQVITSKASVEIINNSKSQHQQISAHEFVPLEELAQLFSFSQWGIVLLEDNASSFCVPSKTLSYIGCGLPVLGLMSRENPAAKLIEECGGFVLEPSEIGVFKASKLIKNIEPHELLEIREASLKYRNKNFNVIGKAEAFLEVFRQLD